MAEKDKELENSVKEIPALIKTIKEWFSEKQKFTEIKAGEKTYKYSTEKFEIGTDVFEGEKPLADGEYDFESGKFTVKGGKVIDIKPKEVPAEVPATDFTAQFEAQKKEFETKLAAQKSELEKQVDKIKEAFDKKVDETVNSLINGKLKEMFELIEKIANSPSVESQFRKRDGEPAPATPRTNIKELMAKAKVEITDKIFKS